jgi:hypothetical protein
MLMGNGWIRASLSGSVNSDIGRPNESPNTPIAVSLPMLKVMDHLSSKEWISNSWSLVDIWKAMRHSQWSLRTDGDEQPQLFLCRFECLLVFVLSHDYLNNRGSNLLLIPMSSIHPTLRLRNDGSS